MPKSYSRLEINNEKEFRIKKNYGYVPIAIYSSNNSISSSLLTVKLKSYKEVLVSQSKIERNVKLSPEMFIARIENVSSVEGTPFETLDGMDLFRSRTVIREGSILIKEMVEQMPIVKIGDKMKMHSGGNGVDVTVDVVSRQEGVVGGIISVQSGSTIYKAKIIDKNNLKLEE